MNSRLKAAAITAGLGLWCVVVAFGLQYLSKLITPEQFVVSLAVIGISSCFYMIYDLIHSQLEYSNKLKSMVDRK